MRIIESCAKCLFDKQCARVKDYPSEKAKAYLAEVKQTLDNRSESDTSPYMVYLFNQIYAKYFNETKSYAHVKKEYNDLVLSMEADLEERIEGADCPLALSLLYARIGNYIDFGAMNHVDKACFLELFDKAVMNEEDEKVFGSFTAQCAQAKHFLLIADNCGELVLDKLFVRQLRKQFPHLEIYVMVRGGEVLNDATMEDARYVGIEKEAELVSNGAAVAGAVYEMMPPEAKELFDHADVILAKGQGNYEALAGQGRHIFYSFLCKCELFTNKFQVPALTGMFIEMKL